MKSHLIPIALCVAAIAGCSNERAEPKDTFAKASAAATSTGEACSPLPANVQLGFPHHLQSDYYYLNVRRMIRRRVVMQYLQGDAAQVQQAVKAAMLSAGFALYDTRGEQAGQIHDRYLKKGYGMAHVLIAPIVAPDAGSLVVKGTVAFDLPPPQFNPPARKAPAAR